MDDSSDNLVSSGVPMLPVGDADSWTTSDHGLKGFLASTHERVATTTTRCRLWSNPWYFGRRTRAKRTLIYLLIAFLCITGLVDIVDRVLQTLRPYLPGNIEWLGHDWDSVDGNEYSIKHWLVDGTLDIHPVNCHSHNDYWRRPPLYTALHAGCIGVEADVWLRGRELYVGHRRFSLQSNRTLRNLYISPLLELLDQRNAPYRLLNTEESYLNAQDVRPLNGVFDQNPSQTLVLLVDFKSSGPELWEQFVSELAPLRDRGYLTHFNGTDVVERPIIAVGTGNAPFIQLTANETYRDVFFDAPLDHLADLSSTWPNPNLAQDPARVRGDKSIREASSGLNLSDSAQTPDGSKISVSQETVHNDNKGGASDNESTDIYSPYNSYYASVSFTKSIGHIRGSRLTQEQLQLIRGQVRGAHQRGLKARYWGIPSWPRGLRNHVWHILMREGVDILNADDLFDATQTDWRRQRSWNL